MVGVPRFQEIYCRVKKCPFNNKPHHGCGRCTKRMIEVNIKGCIFYNNVARIPRKKNGKPMWKANGKK